MEVGRSVVVGVLNLFWEISKNCPALKNPTIRIKGTIRRFKDIIY